MTAPQLAVEGAAAPVAAPPRHVAHTLPYAWPYDGILDAGRLALAIAGAQKWWATSDSDAALDSLARLREAAVAAGVAVVLLVHTAPSLGVADRPPYLPQAGSVDARLLLGTDDAIVIEAHGLDGCFGGPLEPMLRAAAIDRVILAGLGLEGPVHSTLRSLNDQGYECLLVADACAADGPLTRDGAIGAVLMSGGIFGAVGDTAAVVAALASLPAPEVDS